MQAHQVVSRQSGGITLFLGWSFVVLAKLIVVVAFHLWSLSVGRRGLGAIVLGGDDGDLYLLMAETYANTGFFPYRDVYYLWAHIGGEIMAQTGWRGTLPFKAILLAASLLTAVVGVRLLRMLAADVLGRHLPAWAEVTAASALLLFPSTLWVSSYSIYRDAVIYALAMISVYTAYRVLVRRERQMLVLFVPAVLLLFEFRWYAAVAVGVGMMLWLARTGGVRRRGMTMLVSGVLVVVALAVSIRLGLFEALQRNIEMREYFEQTGAGSNIGVSYVRSPVWQWPGLYLYSLASNMLGPLPNQISGLTTVMAFVLEIPLLAFVLWRVARSPLRRRPEVLLLLIVPAVWFALIAIYNDNVGTALRLRVVGYQFLFLVVILDAVARSRHRLVPGVRQARVQTL